MSCSPFLRNTSSSSKRAPNGERYPTSSVVHAGRGVTFHPPRLCACMLPGRGLCSPPTSVIQYKCFSFPDWRRARDMSAGAPPLPCIVTTVPSHRDADLNGSTLAVCSNSPRTLWDLPTRRGLRFHKITGWSHNCLGALSLLFRGGFPTHLSQSSFPCVHRRPSPCGYFHLTGTECSDQAQPWHDTISTDQVLFNDVLQQFPNPSQCGSFSLPLPFRALRNHQSPFPKAICCTCLSLRNMPCATFRRASDSEKGLGRVRVVLSTMNYWNQYVRATVMLSSSCTRHIRAQRCFGV